MYTIDQRDDVPRTRRPRQVAIALAGAAVLVLATFRAATAGGDANATAAAARVAPSVRSQQIVQYGSPAVELQWADDTAAIGYEIWRSEPGEPAVRIASGVRGGGFVDRRVWAGKRLSYTVVASYPPAPATAAGEAAITVR